MTACQRWEQSAAGDRDDYAAVEESLSNAVYHKSYQIGEPITVTVTPERMEITSLPGPDRTISNEDLMNRRLISRRYRNRRIGDFLKELKLVEGRNTGIPTILHAMEANGSELPLFETDEDRTYFTVILPVHKQFLVPETAAPKKKQRRSLPELKELIVVTLAESSLVSLYLISGLRRRTPSPEHGTSASTRSARACCPLSAAARCPRAIFS